MALIMKSTTTTPEARVTCRDWFQMSLKEGLADFMEREPMPPGTAPPSN